MTRPTHEKINLQKRLLLYSAAAGVGISATLAMSAAPTQAVGVVIDVNPDQTVTGPLNDFFLDFDQDGDNEFRLVAQTTTNINQIAVRGLASGADNGTGVIGYTSGGYILPSALAQGVSVCTGAAFQNASGGSRTMALTGTLGTYGAWRGVTDRYLGLRFTLDGDTHFGWAQLDVAADASSFTIKRYGYDNDPDACIPTAVSLTGMGADASAPWWRQAAIAVFAGLSALSLWARRRVGRASTAE